MQNIYVSHNHWAKIIFNDCKKDYDLTEFDNWFEEHHPIGFFEDKYSNIIIAYNSDNIAEGYLVFHRYSKENEQYIKENTKENLEENPKAKDSFVFIELYHVQADADGNNVGRCLYDALNNYLSNEDTVYEFKRDDIEIKSNHISLINKCKTYLHHEYHKMLT